MLHASNRFQNKWQRQQFIGLITTDICTNNILTAHHLRRLSKHTMGIIYRKYKILYLCFPTNNCFLRTLKTAGNPVPLISDTTV